MENSSSFPFYSTVHSKSSTAHLAEVSAAELDTKGVKTQLITSYKEEKIYFLS